MCCTGDAPHGCRFDVVEKLAYLIWDRPSVDGAELRERYLGEVAPALTNAGVVGLEMHLDDDQAPIAGPAPCPDSELPYRAVISFWLPAHDQRRAAEEVLNGIGVRTSGYLVAESTFTGVGPDGPAAHSHAAQPADRRGAGHHGARSPGISTVAVVRRNPTFDERAFREFWYGHQSPMSGEVQPRLHYTRNTVVYPVTPGAPPYDGIVMECWPSVEVVEDLLAFHGGPEVGEENLRVMLDSVTQVFDLESLRSLAMSEYLIGS